MPHAIGSRLFEQRWIVDMFVEQHIEKTQRLRALLGLRSDEHVAEDGLSPDCIDLQNLRDMIDCPQQSEKG